MDPIRSSIDSLGLTGFWTYLIIFLAASLLLIWRLEALLAKGLEGTALGTLVMPYCSGLGNIFFVFIIIRQGASTGEILVNSVVNNVTNLTLVLAVPALLWGLELASAQGAKARRSQAKADISSKLNRLSLLLTLAAVIFFSGVTWALAADGRLDRRDGLALIGLFAFWQCFQVFDVLKHNVRERRSFSFGFYLDLLVILAAAYVLYVSVDWLVAWLAARPVGFIGAGHLGWITGWLMVLPNALLACYYGLRRRAEVVYSSQVGDGHICIPFCVGLAALWHPVAVPRYFTPGLAILVGAALLHAACLIFSSSLPKWMALILLGAYGGFLALGLA